jgi:flagellar FliL protein
VATTASRAAATPDGSAVPTKSRKRLVTLVVAALCAVLVALYMFVGPGAKAQEKTVEKPVPGEVVQLEPITMNLADGRLLKVGLALQLVAEPKEAEVTGSVALDEAISFLGQHTYAQLAVPATRQAAKQELSKRVSKRYHGDVLEIYLTDFVMQ